MALGTDFGRFGTQLGGHVGAKLVTLGNEIAFFCGLGEQYQIELQLEPIFEGFWS